MTEDALGEAFYRLTVQQRDAAWSENERLTTLLRQVVAKLEDDTPPSPSSLSRWLVLEIQRAIG